MQRKIPAAVVRALREPVPTAADFKSTKFTPAETKAWFAWHFLRFASSNFPKYQFSQRFYNQVMNTFGMVAHYNLAGYWAEYFTTTAGKVEFIDQVVRYHCFGDPAHTFSDVEREIIHRLRQVDLLGFYRGRNRAEGDVADGRSLPGSRHASSRAGRLLRFSSPVRRPLDATPEARPLRHSSASRSAEHPKCPALLTLDLEQWTCLKIPYGKSPRHRSNKGARLSVIFRRRPGSCSPMDGNRLPYRRHACGSASNPHEAHGTVENY